jgi:hypothetical protein
MISLSFDRSHKVLCLTFTGAFATEDIEAIDPALIHSLAALNEQSCDARRLFDMR